MKLLLIDKDGTLTQTKSGDKFVNRPWDQMPIDGAKGAIAQYAADGYQIVIISNQGGVGAGHKSLESAVLEMQFCLELFPEILEAYFCPNFSGTECWRVWGNCDSDHRIQYDEQSFDFEKFAGQYRKPNPGMLLLACDIYFPTKVLYVGDMTISNSKHGEDENAAIAAKIPFVSAEKWRNGHH